MARTAKRLIAGSQLTTSAATYYTAPALTTTVIRKLSLTNTSGGAVTATLYLITSGGTAGATNTIASAKSLAAGETWSCSDAEGQVLEAGGFVQALASAGTSITIIGSGIEIT
jgi:predicted phage tail protein